MRTATALLVALCIAATSLPAAAEPRRCAPRGGDVRVAATDVPARGGGDIRGRWVVPAAATKRCPAVVLLPGGGAPVDSVMWAAQALAADGYVTLVVQPAQGGSTASYDAAARSGLDLLTSPTSPYRRITDPTRLGAAGWSLGARSLTRTQAEDPRLDAIVAWDNLALAESGDAGSPLCRVLPVLDPRPPRVPALGQASESCAPLPEAKKTAYEGWRARGVPVVQVTLARCSHFCWSAEATPQQHAVAHHYTLAWFDRWLRGDRSASGRLLARTVAGRPVEQVLSATFRSGAAFDGRDCPDLRRAC